MRYCKKCIIPDTRPSITIGEDGVCNACKSNQSKLTINWSAREQLFRRLADEQRSKSAGYDCLIPVSGGKDSIWQIHQCLKYGLKPLAVTWKNPARTDVGAYNLARLVDMGVDHIDYQISPETEKKFLLAALDRFGATAIPMHMAIFNIPIKIAVKFGIQLVVWGENSALEYGGTEDEWLGSRLDSEWFKKYGVTHGTTAQDWVGPDLSRKEMEPYFGPSAQELEAANIKAVFLGYYFPWDPITSVTVARQYGFRSLETAKTGFYEFADIDDDFISIHHFLKWYKFGMTRTFDNLSIEIRNGRLSRPQALEILRSRGDDTPHADIEKFAKFTGITVAKFYSMIEKFRNEKIWKKNTSGDWYIPDFLLPDWRWNENRAQAASA